MKRNQTPKRRLLLAAILFHRANLAGSAAGAMIRRESQIRVQQRYTEEYRGLERPSPRISENEARKYRRRMGEGEEGNEEEEMEGEDGEDGEDESSSGDEEQDEEEEESEKSEDEEEEIEEEIEEEYNYNDDDNDDNDDGYDEIYMSSLVSTLLGSSSSSGSISDYHLQFTTCTSVEGSANKNYHSTTRGYRYAHHTYLHYHSCKNNTNQNQGYFFRHFWGSEMCHRVSHVIRLDDFFQSTKACVSDYCVACNASCTYDGQCSDTCLDRCDSYYELTEGTMDYYGCAGPYNATDGYEYYFGPVCSQSGGVTKSYFLDENCEISAFSVETIQFDDDPPSSLDVFKFVDSICTSCTVDDVCENVYDSSFHCSDRTMNAVAIGEGTSWQPDEHSEDEGGGIDERQWMEFADQACYKTSTYNQKQQYQSHTGSEQMFHQDVINALMVVGITIMTVGLILFLAMSWKYHVRHSSTFGAETLCVASDDTDFSVDDSFRLDDSFRSLGD
mmetsp:Transcript_26236/g.54795  ORF Transcript_26236/g.54795 Transcript_26236/m.54795 type:complete len:502 (-) Transcript_26236:1058-2563(-)